MFSRIKRWTVRLLGVGILVAAGIGSFHVATNWPRCVITSDMHAIHFSADGATLITGHEAVCIGNVTGGTSGAQGKPPLRVWDTRSGKLVHTLLNDVKTFSRYTVCEKQTLVAVDLGGTIRFADWRTGEEWNIEVGSGEVEHLTVSPRGDLLVVRVTGHAQPEAMIDLKRRIIVQRFDREARGAWFNADGSYWHYGLGGRTFVWNATTLKVEADFPGSMYYKDGRCYVHHSRDDLDLVLRDSESFAVKSRIRPAPPPELPGANAMDAEHRGKIHACRHVSFSASGRLVATYAQPYDAFDGVLEIWETATGQQVAAFPELKRGWGGFRGDDLFVFTDRSHTPREALAVAQLGDQINNVTTVVDVRAGEIRWRRSANHRAMFYVLRNDTAVHGTPEGMWEIHDAATGETRCSVPHPFAPGDFFATFDKKGRLVYAFGKRRTPSRTAFWERWLGKWRGGMSGGVQVLDTASDRIILDLNTAAGVGAVLSDDGGTLLTQDLGSAAINIGGGFGRDRPLFRFYDLHSKKPWFWAAAMPACLLGFVWLWRRWRNGRKRGTKVESGGLVPLAVNSPER